MRILDNLHAFLWLSPTTNYCNAYLIDGDKKILVDQGHHHLFGHVKNSFAELSLSPQDIDQVIITHGHPDHMEGVKEFVDSSALAAVHAAEMDFIEEKRS